MSDAWKIFGITLIVLIIISSTVFVFAYLSRECNNDLDCSPSEYCAFNHKCIPKSTKEPAENLLPSAIILGISIIVSSFILRSKLKKKD